MATYTVSFPDGKYPIDYDPSIPDFDLSNPMFADLVDLSTAVRTTDTSTLIEYELDNGLILKLIGTSFAYEDGEAVGGKINSIELLQSDGTTAVSKLSLSKLSLAAFEDALGSYDARGLEGWLFNRADKLNGSQGADDLYGYGGNDVINGKGGDDFLRGGEGRDTYDGGAGFDQLAFNDSRFDQNALGGIVLDAAKGRVTDAYGNKETFKNIEEFRGTQFADTMKGSGRDEGFLGIGGRDTIDGKGGFDVVRYNRDEEQGGAGIGITADLSLGTVKDGFGKTDKLFNIEGVVATNYDDVLIGDKKGNVLVGNAGDDTLSGGLGNDTLQGGDGADVFIFDTALNAVNNLDQINDFNESEDVFHLDLEIFTALSGLGTLGAAEFVANATGEATDGAQRIIYNTESGEIFYDADGSGAGAKKLFVNIEAGLNLIEDNFIAIL